MTRTGLVVDASVAIKWIVEEPGSDEALALRRRDLAAPALLRIEAANVLRTLAARGAMDASNARNLFGFLQTAPVAIVDHDDALESRALELALDLKHSVYDCLYLALAERMERTLVTADRRFLGIVALTPHADLIVDLTAAGA
jgi:predicted nucleic acid-binding protein